MASLSILMIAAVSLVVVSSVNLPDCLNCEVCVKAVPIRAGGCSLPTVFSGSLETCPADVPSTPCPGSDLEVYDLNSSNQRFFLNPSVTYDFATSKFIIKENGVVPSSPTVAVINKSKKTVFFVDYFYGYINPTIDGNGKAVGYNAEGFDYNFPSDLLGIYTVTTQGDVIPA